MKEIKVMKEDFLNELANSLSEKGYNTTTSYDRVYLSNDEIKCEVCLSYFSDDVVKLSDIETENCYIKPYEDSFVIDDYDSVEEVADEILEVVNAYAGTEANLQKFTKDFINSMNRHGCSLVIADYYSIHFTYKGIDWEINTHFSQATNDSWCFKDILSSYLNSEQRLTEELFPCDLEFDLEKLDVEDIVERILNYIDEYIL